MSLSAQLWAQQVRFSAPSMLSHKDADGLTGVACIATVGVKKIFCPLQSEVPPAALILNKLHRICRSSELMLRRVSQSRRDGMELLHKHRTCYGFGDWAFLSAIGRNHERGSLRHISQRRAPRCHSGKDQQFMKGTGVWRFIAIISGLSRDKSTSTKLPNLHSTPCSLD